MFFDVGPTANDMRKQLVAELFGLILSEQTSDVLRTKEQLGYNVNSVTKKTIHSYGEFLSDLPRQPPRSEASVDSVEELKVIDRPTEISRCNVSQLLSCIGQGS